MALPFQAAEWYREDLVGRALLESRLPRERAFLISKLHPRSGLPFFDALLTMSPPPCMNLTCHACCQACRLIAWATAHDACERSLSRAE